MLRLTVKSLLIITILYDRRWENSSGCQFRLGSEWLIRVALDTMVGIPRLSTSLLPPPQPITTMA
jgi:hypothetical protein